MNLLSIFKRRKPVEQRIFETLSTPPVTPRRCLSDTLRPRPDLRDRRFANWSMERRQRYFDACFGTPQSLWKRGKA